MKRFRSRREFLFESCGGISGLGLAYLLNQEGLLAASKTPHFQPRARSVISLFMSGGVSHVDTFDPKPALKQYAGEPLTGKGDVVVRQGHPGQAAVRGGQRWTVRIAERIQRRRR